MPMMRMASANCKADTTNCVQKLATAEPHACIRGISNRLTVTLMTMPTTAMRFSTFMLPLAVSNVPNR